MRCYTITESQEYRRGLQVEATSHGPFGVRLGSLTLPLEPRVDGHLRACSMCLRERADGEDHPSSILPPNVSAQDAQDALKEGWFVDHLTIDPETGVLHHVNDSPLESRCMVFVAPAMEERATVAYLSNLSDRERTITVRGKYGPHQRVIRDYAPIERAAGVEILYGDGAWALLRLTPGASFRIHRNRSRAGWRECVVHWTGTVLKKRILGYRARRAS